MAADHDDGQSVAAWTGVGILLVGAAVICLGVGFGILWLDIVGIVIAALGLVAGKVLAMAGFGVDKPQPTHSTATGGDAPQGRQQQGREQTQE
jgi:hypothetical protein